MPATPQERSAHARIAALTRVAQEPSGAAMTAKARATFEQSFYDRTDPALPHEERLRQARALKSLHYTELSRRAVIARRQALTAVSAMADAAVELASALACESV